tara:strand:- start:9 stop:269 length:261 start_codon:yes stop_codon:yes gene_type:complete
MKYFKYNYTGKPVNGNNGILNPEHTAAIRGTYIVLLDGSTETDILNDSITLTEYTRDEFIAAVPIITESLDKLVARALARDPKIEE